MEARRLGLLGFGHVAEHGHAPAWQRRDDFRVAAVADPDAARRARARELFPATAIYEDPLALLAHERLDVVDIAAPPSAHAELCLRAAAAGCHVLCEKPLVNTVEDFAVTRAAATAAGVALVTVHNWKQAAQYREVSSVLDAGVIGELREVRIEVERVGRSASVGADWRAAKRIAGGGILVDHGWHALYLLLGMARQRPRRVRAVVERRCGAVLDVEDTVQCTLEFESVRAELFLTWAGAARRNRWDLRGERGRLWIEGDRGELDAPTLGVPLRFSESLSDGSHHAAWFDAVIDELCREMDDPVVRGSNLREAETCLLVTALAYASSEAAGRWLELPASVAPPAVIDSGAAEGPVGGSGVCE
jgi:predicted dehydrogenase